MTRLDLITPLDLPVTVGRYTLTGLLGEGGMARVFRAQMEGALGFKKPAAVKVVLPAGGDRGASLREQLIQEARLGGLLNHPNVVQTFDCGELEGFPYIAMELVEGAGLDDLVEEVGPLSPGALLDIAIQTARGLHHAHSAQHEGEALAIIHRDVKPSNVLIREDGLVKVMDFGIAKVAMQDALSTATGMTKGTPSYMSPEQLAAEPMDARTDLFALGALIHYMRTGRTLFVGSSLTEVMLRIIQVDETVRDLGIFREADDYLPGLGAVMGRLLVKNREDRFSSGAELERELMVLRGRVTADHRILASLVKGSFGAQLADARQKASSITTPLPLAGHSVPLDGTAGVEPGPTRAFPATQAEPAEPGPTRAFPASAAGDRDGAQGRPGGDPQTIANDSSSQGVGASSVSPPNKNGAGAPGPQFPGRSPRHASRGEVPRPSQPKTVPRPKRRTKKRRGKAPRKRQGAWFALLTIALLSVAGFGVTLWLMKGGGKKALPVSEKAPPVSENSELTAAPEGPADIIPDSKKSAASAAPKPVSTKPSPQEAPKVVSKPAPQKPPERAAPPPSSTASKTTSGEKGASRKKSERAAGRKGTSPRTPDSARAPKGASPRTSDPTPADLRLAAEHTPIQRATVGTEKSIVVTVKGPKNTIVILFYGPPGGPHEQVRLTRKGGGIYKGSLSIGEELAGGFEYWLIVKNKGTTPNVVSLGRQSSPHLVSVR